MARVAGASLRTAKITATLASAAALAYLAFFLFGPTYTRCSITAAPGQPQSPQTCTSLGWLQLQLAEPHPGPIDLRPIVFLSLWTLAPLAAAIALRVLPRWPAAGVVGIAFLIEASSIISMGGGFVFALLCGPLLLIALAASITSATAST